MDMNIVSRPSGQPYAIQEEYIRSSGIEHFIFADHCATPVNTADELLSAENTMKPVTESRRAAAQFVFLEQCMETSMAFRTSRIYKALDKHDATTPQQVKDLLAAGDDPDLVDGATGRGYIHKIVELFEAPQEDEFLESQIIPALCVLITAGANINLRDTDGNTPLHLSFILNSGAKIVMMLVKLGADLTILNDGGQKVGDVINKNTDPHMVKALGLLVPGLWHTVETSDAEKCKEMLDKWSKIDITVDGKPLIDRAKELGNHEIIDMLKNYWPTNQLLYSAYAEDTKKMKKIMKKETIDLEVRDMSSLDDDANETQITILGECLMLNLFSSAKFLIEKGANINQAIKAAENEEPLFFHLMKNNPSLMFSTDFSEMLDSADFNLIKQFSVGILYSGFTNSWPSEVIEKMLNKGLNMTARSEEGFSLRDNILVQVAYYPRRKRLEKLQYVDQYIINKAISGELESLKTISQTGYSNLNVCDKKGKPASYLAKKHGHTETSEWLEHSGEIQKSMNSLQEYIRQANLAKAREYLTDELAFTRDRAGRSPIHMAVLFERKFVVRYLLKEYPGCVHIKDDNGRTALHYACAHPDASDLEEFLVSAGADETLQDNFKRCPMDYKLIDEEDSFIESERKKTCAFEIYLLEVYLNFADGIIEDDFDLVRDTRDDLYDDVKMSEIINKMYKSPSDRPPGFLQMCLDHKRENIARYLINSGVSIWEDVVYDGQEMKFPVAVEKAKMFKLNEFLSKKRKEDEEEDEKFKEAEAVLKKSTTWNPGANNSMIDDSDEEHEGKSKSCIIL